MTSGFSTIAGSVLSAYIGMGVPPENLVTASVMSIPASIAISKMRSPETEEPVTRGAVVVDRGKAEKHPPVRTSCYLLFWLYLTNAQANALHAFCKGAVFGLIVAGQILWVHSPLIHPLTHDGTKNKPPHRPGTCLYVCYYSFTIRKILLTDAAASTGF